MAKGLAKRTALVLGGLLTAWALVELTVLALLDHAAWVDRLPRSVGHNLQALYEELDRPILQFDDHQVRYDPGLAYTLRPGEFDFNAREFSTHYSVNRLGVRDDEASLAAPEIVVLGDSFAMGWGVGQEETFAQLIERRTGRRVLNTGVASYGTVRELRMLDRVDTSRMSQLVIQYCDNDIQENRRFQPKNELPISPPAQLEAAFAQDRLRRRYWFGRYSAWLMVGRFLPQAHAGVGYYASVHAEAFLHALRFAGNKPLDNVQIYVLPGNFPYLEGSLRELLQKPEQPDWVRRIHIVHQPEHIDHFRLDEHWTARGHVQIADAILEAMSSP